MEAMETGYLARNTVSVVLLGSSMLNAALGIVRLAAMAVTMSK